MLKFWYEIRFFGNIFDKGLHITCILRPVYAINQRNNSRKAKDFLNFYMFCNVEGTNFTTRKFGTIPLLAWQNCVLRVERITLINKHFSEVFSRNLYRTLSKNSFDFRAKTVRGFAEAGFQKLGWTLQRFQFSSEREGTAGNNVSAIRNLHVKNATSVLMFFPALLKRGCKQIKGFRLPLAFFWSLHLRWRWFVRKTQAYFFREKTLLHIFKFSKAKSFAFL